MLKEIHKAVETFHKIALGTKHNVHKLSETKLAAFITILTELLTARYENIWYPDNPDRGSGYRCIRVNSQSIDPTIVESLKRAKIELKKGLRLTELTIWVDPGVVSVRIGEDGSIGSEIIDEDVYNLGKRTKETALKQSGSDSDEGFSSSRSSSPDSSASERSWSSSPSFSSSPFPSKSASSPSPPATELNSLSSSPAHNSYLTAHQRPSTPLPSSRNLKNQSPAASYFQSQGSRSLGRSVNAFGPAVSSTPNGDITQGHIPGSSVQRLAAYTRPRALFPAQGNGSVSRTSQESAKKITFTNYRTTPAVYGGNLQQSFCDIPAMA